MRSAIRADGQDYMHACDRLNQLRFTDVQQREFVRVALHCCGLVSDSLTVWSSV
jgi:nucleolar MIF4G domain-containing protein 1